MVVTRGQFQPIPNAEVIALQRSNRTGGGVQQLRQSIRTDAMGKGAFDALQPGVWIVQARDSAGRVADRTITIRDSDTLEVALAFDRDDSNVEGVVRESSGTPAVDAAVYCFFLGSDSLPREQSAKTDSQGRFLIGLARPGTSALHCASITMDAGLVPFMAMPGAQVDVAVTSAAGRIVIDDWASRGTSETLWLVSAEGRIINLSWAAMKLWRSDRPLILPRIPSGSWRVVRAGTLESWLLLARGQGSSLPQASTFKLDSGETKRITVYTKPTDDRRQDLQLQQEGK